MVRTFFVYLLFFLGFYLSIVEFEKKICEKHKEIPLKNKCLFKCQRQRVYMIKWH